MALTLLLSSAGFLTADVIRGPFLPFVGTERWGPSFHHHSGGTSCRCAVATVVLLYSDGGRHMVPKKPLLWRKLHAVLELHCQGSWQDVFIY